MTTTSAELIFEEQEVYNSLITSLETNPQPGAITSSVVICAYTEERFDSLCAAVEGCLNQSVQPTEIIVVIDYNSDMKNRAAREITGVTLLDNLYEKGLSGARDTGMEYASGDVVLFLDDDATPRDAWLEPLVAAFEDVNTVMAGGRVEPSWDTKEPAWVPREFNWVIGCDYRGLPVTEKSEIRNPIGASMAIRRSIVKEVGTFTGGLGRNNKGFTGGEETEYAIRATNAIPNSRVIYVPDSVVDHRVPAERAQVGYFLRRCFGEGLSKAVVSEIVGSEMALKSERKHLVSLAKSIIKDVSHGRLGRASISGMGTLFTVYGFLLGTLRKRKTS